jgi:hypothetical protein
VSFETWRAEMCYTLLMSVVSNNRFGKVGGGGVG